ncbi:MAG: hypothetical protein AUJ52_06565 [Elusimicrobia bacterium CG1_02_63_36]|nr:MAG: hypothetical protein AUJ52_06565 [Elusimicrobia bacterium CG1_02_63_36]PJA12712.1 MAG: hypothetical protein COX66_16720 [Elusimicrobia bacterium CG_4_10_14_0_2_um_filter_63_34]PJB24011.1 MAG: hypothetical protein CO113_16040 [Elusimicrobia bacterium CG_4_9_14_3_um_filter_62_55]
MNEPVIEDLVLPEPEPDPLEGVRRGMLAFALLAVVAGADAWMRRPASEEAELPTVVAEEETDAVEAARREEDARAGAHRPISVKHYSDPHGSMWRFFSALLAETQGKRREPIRVLYYGNSEIGFDRSTSQIRRRFQAQFGDGGKGFLVAVPGWRYQRHRDVEWTQSGSWKIDTIRGAKRKDGRYGLGGVLAVSEGPAWTEFATVPVADSRPDGYLNFPAGTRFSRFELYYQTYPGGGDIEIRSDDGARTMLLPGASHEPRDRVAVMTLDDGPHRVRVVAGRRPVRLYGAVLERERGFVLDAAMVIGAWANSQSVFDPEHLKRQIARRRPDLVVFQWGAKELMRNPQMHPAQLRAFRRAYVESIRQTMAARPRASCLVISTKDMGMRNRNLLVTRPAVPQVVEAASEAAHESGCAFLNLYEALGGEGTMRRWYEANPRKVSPDLGHLMRLGAIETGDTISDILLNAYEQFERARRVPST